MHTGIPIARIRWCGREDWYTPLTVARLYEFGVRSFGPDDLPFCSETWARIGRWWLDAH